VSGKESDDLYREIARAYGPALQRLGRAYEADPDKRRDLLQEIHLALWRSFEKFEERCSVRTWIYRIAHNTAASYVIRQSRSNTDVMMSLEEIEATPGADSEQAANQSMALERLLQLIQRLRPVDRQIMLLYLEDMDAPSIGEIMGISPGNVRIQIHRIKNVLSRRLGGHRDA
jgi:RNA polymerase sigma-70 factor (ECF subfamily)